MEERVACSVRDFGVVAYHRVVAASVVSQRKCRASIYLGHA